MTGQSARFGGCAVSDAHLDCRPIDTDQALAEADGLCRIRRAKLTPLRRKALALLLEQSRPVKAYDLLRQLREDGGAKPPTVYRALQFFVEMGLVHRIESLQAYTACSHWAHGHTAVFLICDVCGSVAESAGGESANRLMKDAAGVKFTPTRAVIEVRGVCVACGSAKPEFKP